MMKTLQETNPNYALCTSVLKVHNMISYHIQNVPHLNLLPTTHFLPPTLIKTTHFDFYVVYFFYYIFFYFLVKRTYTAKLSYHITDLHNEALMHSTESFYSNNSSPTNYYFLSLYTCLHFIHIFDS